MKKIVLKSHYLVFLFALLLNYSFAQTSFKDGLAVLKNGDSLHGQIDYRNWEVNPLKIRFKNATSENVYSPKDLLSFEITGHDKYVSAIVSKDMRPIDVDKISYDEEDITITDTAFLRVLVDGPKLKLYELIDFKPHFFIQKNVESKVDELIYKKYLSNQDKYLIEKKIYQQQLIAFSIEIDAPRDIIPKIERSRYRVEEIRSIVRQLNGEDEQTVKATEKKAYKSKKQILVGAGVQFYSFSFNGDILRYSGLQFDNGIGPIVNVGYEIFGGRDEQRLSLRLELAYNQMKLNGNQLLDEIGYPKKEYHFRLTQNNIIPAFAVIYHFFSTRSVRIYAGLGAGYVFSSYPTNTVSSKNVLTGAEETSTPDIEPEKSWLMANALLGAKISNKINLGLSTKLTGAFYKYSALGTKYFPVNLTVNYIFSTGKKSH